MTFRWSIDQLTNPAIKNQVQEKLAKMNGTATPEEPKKKSKYLNVPVFVGKDRFPSTKEYETYLTLQDRETRGEISELRRQVKFSLFDPGGRCRGEHMFTYRADFVWRERDGALVVADAKSEKTRKLRDWPRTKAMMRACHSIEVLEL
jgi:hypothetical protein